MAKFYGRVGYVETVETRPGVYEEVATERVYCGDTMRMSKSWQSSEHLNDDLQVNTQISIVVDPYACQHFHALRYVEYMGALWKITNAELLFPRITLTVGGVYNGTIPSGTTTDNP